MNDRQVSVVFSEIVALSTKLGVKNINQLDGCWEYCVDDQWWIAVNGHGTPTKCTKGTEVEPFGCYVEYNGWPAGILNPFGGIIAYGSEVNEDTLIAALVARAAQL